MKVSRRKVLKAGAALAAASTLPTFALAQAKTVKLGMSMPQTGPLGAGGQAALLALRMWVDEVNVRAPPTRRGSTPSCSTSTRSTC